MQGTPLLQQKLDPNDKVMLQLYLLLHFDLRLTSRMRSCEHRMRILKEGVSENLIKKGIHLSRFNRRKL
jgi:hypothetical protein